MDLSGRTQAARPAEKPFGRTQMVKKSSCIQYMYLEIRIIFYTKV